MQRPTSALVFGILNIAFGSLSLIGSVFSWWATNAVGGADNPFWPKVESGPLYDLWLRLGHALGLVAALVLLAAGIGLLKMKPWARRASVVYAIYSLVMVVLGTAMTWFFVFSPMLEQSGGSPGSSDHTVLVAGIIGGLFGGLFGLIFPAALLYFMTRPRLVLAFEGSAFPAVEAPGDSAFESPSLPEEDPGGFPVAAESTSPYTPPRAALADPVGSGEDRGEELLATVIPVRNKPALVSYYLGIFSLFALVPVVGVLGVGMAVAALILGLKGRKLVLENPSAKGTAHAWVGILGGIFWGLLGILMQAGSFALMLGFLR